MEIDLHPSLSNGEHEASNGSHGQDHTEHEYDDGLSVQSIGIVVVLYVSKCLQRKEGVS